MSDERARKYASEATGSGRVSGVLGAIAALMLLTAVGSYSGTGPQQLPPAAAVLFGLSGLMTAAFSAAFAAASYLLGTMAEAERLP